MTPIVELDNVHVLFGRICALDIEKLRIEAGERLFVLGGSGSGKTTLTRLIKGRLAPSTGSVRVLGARPTSSSHSFRRRQNQSQERRVAMIDQEFFLVPRLSVVGNVLSGCLGRVPVARSLVGWYPQMEWDKAEAVLKEVGLEGKGGERVENLSGGQKQRAAIARALMQEADVILADEPISNLDPELAEEALRLLVECVERRGVTLLVNLHQPSLARQFASRLLGLSQGKVVYDGTPQDFSAGEAEFLYRDNGSRPRSQKEASHEQPAPSVAAETRRSGLRLVRR